MKSRYACVLLTTVLACWAAGPTMAQEAQTIELAELPDNQEMRIITIELAPGQASAPHRHNAHVFVYVLDGVIEMQVRNGPLMRLHPGDTFYESPDDIHQVSRNASSTEPARFVVHMLRTMGTPVSVTVE